MFLLKNLFQKSNLVPLIEALITRRDEIADTLDLSSDSPVAVSLDRESKLIGCVIEGLHKHYGSQYLGEIIADVEIGALPEKTAYRYTSIRNEGKYNYQGNYTGTSAVDEFRRENASRGSEWAYLFEEKTGRLIDTYRKKED